jgi:hypothetical protein
MDKQILQYFKQLNETLVLKLTMTDKDLKEDVAIKETFHTVKVL